MGHIDLTRRQEALSLAIAAIEGQPLPLQNGAVTGAVHVLRQLLAHEMEEAEYQQEASSDPSDLDLPLSPLAWGRSLRERREGASLTRAQLAKLMGISEASLRSLELGRRAPTRNVLTRLVAVSELRLDPTDALLRHPMSAEAELDLAPNCWLAPGFDSIKMIKELALQLNGMGGHIEQSALYLDHMSAACWCAIADQEDYVAAQTGKPLDRAAAQILKCVGGAGIDVIALGCGDGKNEVRLVQHLLERVEHGDLRLYLLDISQPLLSSGYKHAADTLADRRGVAIFAIQGNFHDLPRYTQLLYTPQRAHRRRVVCMFGYTFGNLQNEILFVRDSLVGFAPGDLLLLDVGLVCAPVERPEEIQKKDPRLSGRLPVGWQRRYDEWLAGPIKRYGRDVSSVEFRPALDLSSCPVPGSYAVELRATVRASSSSSSNGSAEKEFSIFRVKRYDALKLIHTLKQLGWDPVDGYQYGNDPRLLYLFRRRAG